MSHAKTRQVIDVCLNKPIIPYVLADRSVDYGSLEGAGLVFLQGGDLTNMPEQLEPFRRGPLSDIPLMLHIDLVAGIARDEAGLRYLATLGRISGIITVHHHLATVARRLGMMSVVRLFLHDGRAIERGLAVLKKSKADIVEMLPGVAAMEVAHEFRGLGIPLIAGGLIRTQETVDRILQGDCRAVSTSQQELWALNR